MRKAYIGVAVITVIALCVVLWLKRKGDPSPSHSSHSTRGDATGVKVIGDQITFTAGTQQYTGRVNGNAIEGIAQTSAGWRATR